MQTARHCRDRDRQARASGQVRTAEGDRDHAGPVLFIAWWPRATTPPDYSGTFRLGFGSARSGTKAIRNLLRGRAENGPGRSKGDA